MAVQWSRLHISTAGGMESIPDWETKIPFTMQHGQKNNKSPGDIRYSMVSIVSDSVHLKVADLKSSHPRKKIITVCGDELLW